MKSLLVLLMLITPTFAMSVNKRYCEEPCDITVTIHMDQPSIINEVCLHLDGNKESLSCFPPYQKTQQVQLRELPSGDYDIWTTIQTNDNHEYSSGHQSLSVVGQARKHHKK